MSSSWFSGDTGSGPCELPCEQLTVAGTMRGRMRRTMAPVRMTGAVELVVLKDPKMTKYMPVMNARM